MLFYRPARAPCWWHCPAAPDVSQDAWTGFQGCSGWWQCSGCGDAGSDSDASAGYRKACGTLLCGCTEGKTWKLQKKDKDKLFINLNLTVLIGYLGGWDVKTNETLCHLAGQCHGTGAPPWSCFLADPGTDGKIPTRTSPMEWGAVGQYDPGCLLHSQHSGAHWNYFHGGKKDTWISN